MCNICLDNNLSRVTFYYPNLCEKRAKFNFCAYT